MRVACWLLAALAVMGANDREGDGECTDRKVKQADWHDTGGPKYNCGWYGGRANRCSKYGTKYAREDMTASDACCICGGGVAKSIEALSPTPELPRSSLTVTLRMHNVTEEDMTLPKRNFILKSLSLVLELPKKDIQLGSFVEVELTNPKKTPAPTMRDPWANRGVQYGPISSSNAPGGSSGGPGSGGRLSMGGGISSSVQVAVAKKIDRAVDLEIHVQTSSVKAFRKNWVRSIRKKFMKRMLRRRMKMLTRTTIAADIRGPACLDICNDSNEQEEDGQACYCSRTCTLMNDCCPSYYTLPCESPEIVTWAPTPNGWGDHWKPENQKWSQLG